MTSLLFIKIQLPAVTYYQENGLAVRKELMPIKQKGRQQEDKHSGSVGEEQAISHQEWVHTGEKNKEVQFFDGD